MFGSYLKACGLIFTITTLVSYLWYLVAQTAANIWLSEWSNDQYALNDTHDIKLRNLRLAVYGGLGGAQGKCMEINTKEALKLPGL